MASEDPFMAMLDARIEELINTPVGEEVARRLIKDNMPPEKIAYFTGLSIDRVQSLYSGGKNN
jgi:hypothetical protein